MAAEDGTFLVDGWDINNAVGGVEVDEGTHDTPDPGGDTVAVEGLDGEWDPYGGPGQPRPPDGPGLLTLDMWLIGGAAPNGNVPAGSSTANEYFRVWDDLVRRFHRRRLTIDWVGSGDTRRAVGRLVSGLKPSRDRGSPWYGRYKAVIRIPAGHWVDLNPVSTGVQQLGNGGTLDLSVFAAATAPCTELLVRFGPRSSTILAPRLATSYGYVGWTGSIAAGRQLEFDTATGLLGPGSGAAWTPGAGTFEEYSPGPRLFEVDPSEPLLATFTHSGSGTVPVEVLGRRRYRTSGGAGQLVTAGSGYGATPYGTGPYGG